MADGIAAELKETPEAEKITVLEALASEVVPTGPNMSNRSTPPMPADLDDQ
jgi:hypothetical protein